MVEKNVPPPWSPPAYIWGTSVHCTVSWAEQKPFITSAPCECGVGLVGGNQRAVCFPRTIAVCFMILFLTETKSIVSHSLVSCLFLFKKREKERVLQAIRRGWGALWDRFQMSMGFYASHWSMWSVHSKYNHCNKEKIRPFSPLLQVFHHF